MIEFGVTDTLYGIQGMERITGRFSDRPVRITGNETVSGIDFGEEFLQVGIHGQVWARYAPSNGLHDSIETSLAMSGWTVFLDDVPNGVRDPGEQWVTTDQYGRYRFPDLPPRPGIGYRIALERQSGWDTTFPPASPC